MREVTVNTEQIHSIHHLYPDLDPDPDLVLDLDPDLNLELDLDLDLKYTTLEVTLIEIQSYSVECRQMVF